MENKELYKKSFNSQKITDVVIDEESVTFKLTDEEFTLSSYHGQDCCEHVYADFSIVKYYENELKDKSIEEVVIKKVEGMGFLICINRGWDESVKIFVPCYNFQNGYYSSDLQLRIKSGDTTTEIDISDLVEDHID